MVFISFEDAATITLDDVLGLLEEEIGNNSQSTSSGSQGRNAQRRQLDDAFPDINDDVTTDASRTLFYFDGYDIYLQARHQTSTEYFSPPIACS